MLTTAAAVAYHGGGYGYGGGRGGYGGGYYRGGYFYGGGIGIGIGLYPYGGYAYPYAYDPLIVPRVAYYPPVAGVDPGPGAPQVAGAPDGARPTNAEIRVLLPDPNAIVLFDGSKTTQTGTDRYFHTPPLTAGANNSYRIRAIWQENGKEMSREDIVPVAPGQGQIVDFTRPRTEPLPAPIKK